jgi:hypothetical protein
LREDINRAILEITHSAVWEKIIYKYLGRWLLDKRLTDLC